MSIGPCLMRPPESASRRTFVWEFTVAVISVVLLTLVLIRSAVHAAIRDAPNARETRKIIPELIFIQHLLFSEGFDWFLWAYAYSVKKPKDKGKGKEKIGDKITRKKKKDYISGLTLPSRTGGQDLVRKAPRQRIHRTCHRCQTDFAGEKVCKKCNHNRCKKCPREPLVPCKPFVYYIILNIHNLASRRTSHLDTTTDVTLVIANGTSHFQAARNSFTRSPAAVCTGPVPSAIRPSVLELRSAKVVVVKRKTQAFAIRKLPIQFFVSCDDTNTPFSPKKSKYKPSAEDLERLEQRLKQATLSDWPGMRKFK